LAVLLDVKFERRLGPVLMRWVYIGAMFAIGSVAFFLLMLLWWLAAYAGGVGWFIFIPAVLAGAAVALLLVRIACKWLVWRVVGPQPRPDRP
jgi:hypothetical protein